MSDSYLGQSNLANPNVYQALLNNTDIACYHEKAIFESLLTIYRLHVNFMVSEMISITYSLPQTIKIKRTSTKHKRNVETTQSPTLYSFKLCSGNSYVNTNPLTGESECICFQDKNCFIETQSISDSETLHPLIVICGVIITGLLIVYIYQSTDFTSFI